MRKLYFYMRFVALILALFFMGMRLARAETQESERVHYSTRASASAACTSADDAFYSAKVAQGYTPAPTHDLACQWYPGGIPFAGPDASYPAYYWQTTANTSSGGRVTFFGMYFADSGTTCASPNVESTDGHGLCTPPDMCASKPVFEGKIITSAGATTTNQFCHESCKFYMAGGTESANPDGTKTDIGKFYPYPSGSGGACTDATANETPKSSSNRNGDCHPAGTSGALAQCFDSANNKMCIVTPRGNKACWSVGQNDTKVSADQKEALSKAAAPTAATAPAPLLSADTATVTSVEATSPTNTTTTVNNVTYSNTTGVPGTTTSTTGTGSSTGTAPDSGSGSGSGSSDCTSDCTGAGTAGGIASAAALYTVGTDTFGGIASDYLTHVQGSPLVSAATGFFSVTVSGACPAFELPATAYWAHETFTGHCSGALSNALGFGGYILLGLACWTAIKIGFV